MELVQVGIGERGSNSSRDNVTERIFRVLVSLGFGNTAASLGPG